MTRETFSNLILDSESTLYRVAMSMLRNEKDCEDAVQTAVLTAFEKLGTLKHEEYFKTWLVRILINVCNKQLKSSAKTIELHDTDITSDSAEASTEIRMAIESLPVKIRQVVVLYYIEQFTVKEIKQILKIPEGTVKSNENYPCCRNAAGDNYIILCYIFYFLCTKSTPLKRVIGERRFLCLSSVPKKQNKSSGSILTRYTESPFTI